MEEMFLHHVCIQTNCYEASLKFYCDLLEMDVIEETKNFHGRDYNTWLKGDQLMIEMQTPKQKSRFQEIDKEHAGIAHLCFWVKDIEKQVEKLKAKGIDSFKLHQGQIIYEVNGGKLFKVQAPEGTILEFRDKKEC